MRARSLVTVCILVATISPARSEPTAYLRPVRGAIIRHFEPPPTPYAAGHRGIDMAAPVGTAVLASESGIVAFAGQVGGRLFVSIDHADGLRSTYSYLGSVAVRAGETVARGSPIATSGTGHTEEGAPHLHFGLRRGEDYLDPELSLIATLRDDLSQALRLVR